MGGPWMWVLWINSLLKMWRVRTRENENALVTKDYSVPATSRYCEISAGGSQNLIHLRRCCWHEVSHGSVARVRCVSNQWNALYQRGVIREWHHHHRVMEFCCVLCGLPRIILIYTFLWQSISYICSISNLCWSYLKVLTSLIIISWVFQEW